MKKHLIAAAALATLSTAALAQSVTMYGVVDLAITKNDKAKTTSLEDGGLTPNIIGFKGSEDLGGGLKATFNLEGHYSSATGSTGLNSAYPASGSNQINKLSNLFARQANVGLTSSLGTVTVGNQYGAGVLAFAATDPRGLRETYSGLSFWLVPGLVTNAASNTIGHVFYNNAVGVSTKVGVASLAYTHSFGEQSGDTGKGTADSAGIVLNPVAGLTLSAGWGSNKTLTTSNKDNTISSFGASYKFGNATISANRLVNKLYSSGAVSSEIEVTGFGGSYQLTSALSANAAYYKADDKKVTTKNSDNYIVGLEYGLSKRTTLYTQAAFSDNDGAVVTGSFGGIASTSNSTVQVGVRHTF